MRIIIDYGGLVNMQSEIQIQGEFFRKCWNELPETRDCLYHVANEAKRTEIEWSQLKASGFRKGIQDMHFAFKGSFYHIELKTEDGKLSPHQKAVHCAHAGQGFPTWIFRCPTVAFEFVKSIVVGNGTISFSHYKSPYCLKPEMYQLFALEAKQSDCKHKGSPCVKCNWIKGMKLTVL